MSLVDKVTTGTYNFVSLIVKTKLLTIAFSWTWLSIPAADKTQYLVYLTFNSILQSINAISSDVQKFLKYFTGTAIVAFFRTPFALSGSVFPNNLALCFKILKLSLLAISLLELVASSL